MVADPARRQHGACSLPASQLVPRLLDAARRSHASPPSPADLEPLRAWSYVMSRDDAAPLLYEVWLDQLERHLHLAQAGTQSDDPRLPLPQLTRQVATAG